MGSPTLWSLILILTALLNSKPAGAGELPEINVEPSVNKTTTTPATTTIPATAHTMKPTTHTTRNSTQAPTSPSNTTVNTTAHTTQSTNHTTTNSTQAPTKPASTTAHTTANTSVPTNHTTANSTITPTPPVNITTTIPANHTTANSTVTVTPTVNITTTIPANHTTANSTVTVTPPVNITTTIPSNHTTTVPANLTTHTTSNGTHTTTHITVIPTPTYPPKPSPPTTGNYSVSVKGAKCIMALMGLQLIIHNAQDGYFSIAPNQTQFSGNCGSSSSNLNITFHEGFINFNFMKDKDYYFINRIQALLHPLSVQQIQNQTLMKTKLGSSYKCKSTQTFHLQKSLSLIMVNARIQAFDIQHNNFGTESQCFQDQSSKIVVAVGLTVVILIILAIILYFIYRRRKLSGYQRI